MRTLLLYLLFLCLSLTTFAGLIEGKVKCERTSKLFFDSVKKASRCKNIQDCVRHDLLNGASVCTNKIAKILNLISKQKQMILACRGVMEVGIPYCGEGVMTCDSILGCHSLVD